MDMECDILTRTAREGEKLDSSSNKVICNIPEATIMEKDVCTIQQYQKQVQQLLQKGTYRRNVYTISFTKK